MVAAMRPVISISKLTKTYPSGLSALKDIDLEIRKGEIFALLGRTAPADDADQHRLASSANRGR